MDKCVDTSDQPASVKPELGINDRLVQTDDGEIEPVSFVCPDCGWYVDSPVHYYTCKRSHEAA